MLNRQEIKQWAWTWANRLNQAFRSGKSNDTVLAWFDETNKIVNEATGFYQDVYTAALTLSVCAYYEYLFYSGTSPYQEWAKPEIERNFLELENY